MDDMLRRALDAFKAGVISADALHGGLAHIMAALDQGNIAEARKWFEQDGVDYFADADTRL